MSEITIRIPTPLRSYTGGSDEVKVEATTVREALAALGADHEGVLDPVLDSDGNLRRFVNLYVHDRNITALQGLDTATEDGAVISIIPAVAGGGPR